MSVAPASVVFDARPVQAQEIVVAQSVYPRARNARPSTLAPYPARRTTTTRATPYPAPGHRTPPRQKTRTNGGLFGMLFGSPNPDRYRRRDPGSANQDYYYSPSPSGYGSYKTLCVRLCDGYYWPVSNATGRGRLAKDAEQCQSSCSTEARLFFQHSSVIDVNAMVDMEGKPYMALANALRYRQEYDASCTCKPQPWSAEAKQEYARRIAVAAAEEAGGETDVAGMDVQPGQAGQVPLAQQTGASVPVASSRPVKKRKRFWHSFLPFGRWMSGG